MRTILVLIILVIVAVSAYWYFGPLSSADAQYWNKINDTLPEQYRKPAQPVQPAPAP
jgi:hypothetical protein